jgi:hypothetical protein
MLAGNDFVHRVADCLKPLQLLYLSNHGWLIDVDHGVTAPNHSYQM